MRTEQGLGGSTGLKAGQRTVLVIDDEQANIRLFSAYLENGGHRTIGALDGRTALELARQHAPDLILLDMVLPGMSGIEVAGLLKGDPLTCKIPIIMVTGMSDRSSRMLALNSGVEEFLSKPVDAAELTVRVRNLLRLKSYQDLLESYNAELEERVAQRAKQLTSSYREAIFTLTRAAEYKDEETGAHVQRIGHYSERLAEALGLDAQFRDEILHASPMHDVGKIGIPDTILLKPSGLSPTEWEMMKTHTSIGASVLSTGASPYLVMGAQIARSHHERWDGTGYPDCLKGEQIPLPARIACICDIYDALRSKRSYKPAFDHERALEIITVGDGRTQPQHFDPQVLDGFRKVAPLFAEIFAELSD
jgi:putative two-component system response regulator